MLKEDELIGAIVSIARRSGRSPTSRSSWSRTLPTQAVIAIENTRLLNELRQRTDDLANRWNSRPPPPTCSRSSAARPSICRWCSTRWSSPPRGSVAQIRTAIRIARGGLYHHVADYGFRSEVSERMMHEPVAPTGGSMVARVLLEGKAVHVVDAQADLHENMAAWRECRTRARFSECRSCVRALPSASCSYSGP